eukprot:20192-Heterococcus_DN1.PRE.5
MKQPAAASSQMYITPMYYVRGVIAQHKQPSEYIERIQMYPHTSARCALYTRHCIADPTLKI